VASFDVASNSCQALLFGVIRHRLPIYFGRRRLRNLTHRPPPLPRPDGTWAGAYTRPLLSST
jgi:hypothetical protein